MNLTLARSDVLHTLKMLKSLNESMTTSFTAIYRNAVYLQCDQDSLVVASGPLPVAYAKIILPAEVKQAGQAVVPYKLYDLLRLMKDEQVELSLGKTLSIKGGDSKFKATLALLAVEIPHLAAQDQIDGGLSASVVVNTDDVSVLCKACRTFIDDKGIYRWAKINVAQDGISGSIRPSSAGGIEDYPMAGESQGAAEYVLLVDVLEPLLAFCGQRVRIGVLSASNGNYKVEDPDNLGWWGIMCGIAPDLRYDK